MVSVVRRSRPPRFRRAESNPSSFQSRVVLAPEQQKKPVLPRETDGGRLKSLSAGSRDPISRLHELSSNNSCQKANSGKSLLTKTVSLNAPSTRSSESGRLETSSFIPRPKSLASPYCTRLCLYAYNGSHNTCRPAPVAGYLLRPSALEGVFDPLCGYNTTLQ
jgi:hypothetical protein